MSHAFYKYKTEAERLEHLRLQRIENIKRQLRLARAYVEQQADVLKLPEPRACAVETVMLQEEARRDELAGSQLKDHADFEAFAAASEGRRRTDLSGLLKAGQTFEGEMEQRLREAVERVNQRIPDSDKARLQHKRLIEKLHQIMENPAYSAEERLQMAEQRITLYIENVNYDHSALDEDLLMDYKALCILLGEDEEIVPVQELRARVDQMLSEYEKLPETEMVAGIVEEAMEQLGLQAEGSCILDEQLEGQLFGSSECSVFVSCSGSGILIEPVRTSSDLEEEDTLKQQHAVCRKERELIRAVEERGIRLMKVYSEEVPAGEVAGQEDVRFPEGKLKEQHDRLERQRELNRRRRRRRKKAGEMTYD